MPPDEPNPYESAKLEPEEKGGQHHPGNTAGISSETMVRAHQIHLGRSLIISRIIRAAFGLFWLCLGVRFILVGKVLGGVFFMGVGAFFVVRAVLATYFLRRAVERQFEQMGIDREFVTFDPNPDYLRIVTESSEVRVKWTEICKWKEVDELVLAYRHDSSSHVIPIGQLDSQIQHDIREHLSRHSVRQ